MKAEWWAEPCVCGRQFHNEAEAQLHMIVMQGCGAAMIANKAKQKSRKRSATNMAKPPTYATPPGDTLRETLKAKGISQTLLAETMRRPIKTINEIIHAKARITEQTAIELEHALNIPAHFWMALESNYRIALARQNDQAHRQTGAQTNNGETDS